MTFFAVGCSDDEEGPTDTGGDGVSTISGVVAINCQPEILDVHWALTQPSGDVLQGSGNAYLEDMPTGTYQISWADMPGWTSPVPNPRGKDLTSTGTVAFGGVYQPRPGVLIIATTPNGVPASWTLTKPDNSVVQGTGTLTLTEQELGDYTLAWDPLDGWEIPDPSTQTLESAGLGLLFAGTFEQSDDNFFVRPQPDGLAAGWQISGPSGYSESGAGTSNVGFSAEGDYTITWSDLTGYTAPNAETIAVIDSTAYELTGIYSEITGTVDIDGSMGSNDVSWILEGPSGITFSGMGDQVLNGLLAGTYTMNWPVMEEWTSPDPSSQDLAVGGSMAFTASHAPALTIATDPDDLMAPWQLSGPSGFNQSGSGGIKLEGLATGSYTLNWQDVDGWTAPAASSGTLASDQGLVLTGTYEQGSLSLFITPEPADLAADWHLTSLNGLDVSGTGQQVVQVPSYGLYRLSWSPVDGFMTPGIQDFTVADDDPQTLTGSYLLPLEMIQLTGDTFDMGSSQQEYCRSFEELRHEVTLTNDFSIMSTEVTNAQYRDMANWALDNGYAILTENVLQDAIGSSIATLLTLNDANQDIYVVDGRLACNNPDYPVNKVTWYGAASYCDWLSMLRGYPRAYNHTTWLCNDYDPYGALGFRLPTEAEWEFAARAGTTSAFANGGITNQCTSSTLELIAWYSENATAWVHPVGQLDANDWGLYDMHGNLAEWTNDWHNATYYQDLVDTDPPGPSYSEDKVIRGGYFYSETWDCRSAARDKAVPASGSFSVGFRVARSGS